MNTRTIKILFKDSTSITVEIKDIWLDTITDEIEHAMELKLPYILNFHNLDLDIQKDYYDTLIIPTENIEYIRIIGKQDEVEKEHKDD